MALTNDDPSIIKVADFGLAQAIDSFTTLMACSFARSLFSQSAISNLHRADDACDAQLLHARSRRGECASPWIDHLVDSWSGWRHRVLYVRLCPSVARTRLFMCKELRLSG